MLLFSESVLEATALVYANLGSYLPFVVGQASSQLALSSRSSGYEMHNLIQSLTVRLQVGVFGLIITPVLHHSIVVWLILITVYLKSGTVVSFPWWKDISPDSARLCAWQHVIMMLSPHYLWFFRNHCHLSCEIESKWCCNVLYWCIIYSPKKISSMKCLIFDKIIPISTRPHHFSNPPPRWGRTWWRRVQLRTTWSGRDLAEPSVFGKAVSEKWVFL